MLRRKPGSWQSYLFRAVGFMAGFTQKLQDWRFNVRQLLLLGLFNEWGSVFDMRLGFHSGSGWKLTVEQADGFGGEKKVFWEFL